MEEKDLLELKRRVDYLWQKNQDREEYYRTHYEVCSECKAVNWTKSVCKPIHYKGCTKAPSNSDFISNSYK